MLHFNHASQEQSHSTFVPRRVCLILALTLWGVVQECQDRDLDSRFHAHGCPRRSLLHQLLWAKCRRRASLLVARTGQPVPAPTRVSLVASTWAEVSLCILMNCLTWPRLHPVTSSTLRPWMSGCRPSEVASLHLTVCFGPR